MEKFAIGVMVGALCGALLVTNNYKMRTLVRKTQEEMKAKFDKMVDEKIQATEELTEEMQEGVEKATEKMKQSTKKTQ